jgi:hypothetical protein
LHANGVEGAQRGAGSQVQGDSADGEPIL